MRAGPNSGALAADAAGSDADGVADAALLCLGKVAGFTVSIAFELGAAGGVPPVTAVALEAAIANTRLTSAQHRIVERLSSTCMG